MASICAHEFGHCWQTEYGSHMRQLMQPGNEQEADRVREGFCAWIEFKFHCHERTGFARAYLSPETMLTANKRYRQGLRRMLTIERDYGEYGVFWFATTGREP